MNTDLAVVGLNKRFQSTQAIDDVSFEVAPKSFFSLLGPSGCGKTTLLRTIAGFIAPDGGDVYIRGERVNQKPPYRRNTAMVFQNYALFPHMTVFDNVAFGLQYRGVARRDRAVRVGHALERVGLSRLDARYPSQLSGGQQQRAALARAIVTEPALLLLDEPLSNLDLRLRQQMRVELRRIQKDVQITTIYVTHDQAEAFSMSDKIAVMNRGKIVQLGSPDDVYLRPTTEFVLTFIGDTNKFACTLMGREGDDLMVRTEDGLSFRVRDEVSAAEKAAQTGPRYLFFREEQARLVRTPGTANSFAAKVEAIQNLGPMLRYTVRLGNGSALRATAPTTRANVLRLGEDIFAEIDPADCVLIKPD